MSATPSIYSVTREQYDANPNTLIDDYITLLVARFPDLPSTGFFFQLADDINGWVALWSGR